MRPPQIAIPTPRPSPPSTQPVVLGITLADPGLLAREAGGRDLPAAVAIVTVLPGSIADIGGLKSGDWLLALGQRRTQNPKALVAALRAVERGSAVHATVLRAGRTIDVVLPF